MITWENYEEYMMMHADGELQPAEVDELMAFIGKHPQLKSEMADFERLRLVSDNTLVFADKHSLIKQVPVKRIALPVWKKYSIAAGIAAIMVLAFYKLSTNNNNNDNYAVVYDVKKPTTAPVHKTDIAVNTDEVKEEIKDITPASQEHTKDKDTHKEPALAHTTKVKHDIIKVPVQQKEEQLREATAMNTLPVTGIKEVRIDPVSVATIQATEVPAYTITADESQKKSLWDKLPIDDTKKKELGNIASSIKDATDGQRFSVKMERKKLVFSF